MQLAEAHARRQPATHAYLFTWESPALGGALGSCHALDVPFVFGGVEEGSVSKIRRRRARRARSLGSDAGGLAGLRPHGSSRSPGPR